MFKTVNKDVWVFDVEWDLDPETGRRNFELAEDAQDIDVLKQMWEEGGKQMKKILCLTLRLQFAGLYQLQPLSELKRETAMLPCL